MAEDDLYGFDEEGAKRVVDVVHHVEANPLFKITRKKSRGRSGQLIGKITAAGDAAGYYDVVQMVWDGAAWDTVASGLTWDGEAGNLPEVYEINALEGLPADTIVFPYLVGASDGSFQWVFAAGGGGPDENKVMVSANDTTPNYLLNKLVAGTYIDLTENNDGGDETITIDVDLTEVSGYNGSNDQVLVNESGTIKWVDLANFVCP